MAMDNKPEWSPSAPITRDKGKEKPFFQKRKRKLSRGHLSCPPITWPSWWGVARPGGGQASPRRFPANHMIGSVHGPKTIPNPWRPHENTGGQTPAATRPARARPAQTGRHRRPWTSCLLAPSPVALPPSLRPPIGRRHFPILLLNSFPSQEPAKRRQAGRHLPPSSSPVLCRC